MSHLCTGGLTNQGLFPVLFFCLSRTKLEALRGLGQRVFFVFATTKERKMKLLFLSVFVVVAMGQEEEEQPPVVRASCPVTGGE